MSMTEWRGQLSNSYCQRSIKHWVWRQAGRHRRTSAGFDHRKVLPPIYRDSALVQLERNPTLLPAAAPLIGCIRERAAGLGILVNGG